MFAAVFDFLLPALLRTGGALLKGTQAYPQRFARAVAWLLVPNLISSSSVSCTLGSGWLPHGEGWDWCFVLFLVTA
jgi:hypothetical protein